MFTKLTNVYNLGIERYKSTDYTWERPFLKGRVSVLDEKPDEFFVSAEPNLPRLQTLDAPESTAAGKLKAAFNEARNLTLYLGHYPSLDDIEAYVDTLEGFYSGVLEERGAAQRVLRDGLLRPTNQDTARNFGEALKLARNEEIFSALRDGRPVAFEQIAGRLLRPLANTLNVSYSEEVERLADNPRKYHSVTYTFEKIATFIFLDNGDDDFPTVIRRSYNENTGNYQQTFTGPATLDSLQRHVFSWLADAMREKMPANGEESDIRIVRDLSLGDIAEYSARDHGSLWRAIKRGERDDVFNHAVTGPRPDAMMEQYRTITGTDTAQKKGPFIRLIK